MSPSAIILTYNLDIGPKAIIMAENKIWTILAYDLGLGPEVSILVQN